MHESNLSVRNVTYAFVTYYIEKKKVKRKKSLSSYSIRRPPQQMVSGTAY